ncbi:MAG: hypothetical protein ACKOWF_11850 [Chloroflexota bacterium]
MSVRTPLPASSVAAAVIAALLAAWLLVLPALAQEDLPSPGVADAPRTLAEAGEPSGGWIAAAAAPGEPVDPAAFLALWGSALETAVQEIGAPLPPLDSPLEVRLYAGREAMAAAESALLAEPGPPPAAQATADGALVVAVDPLLALSEIEAVSALRHAAAHALVARAGGRGVPAGFAEGYARYVERAPSARLARMAAIVQDARSRNDLLTWSDLNRPRADMSDADRFGAHAYSMVAFLVERYGLRTFGEFLFGFTFEPDWRSVMRVTYQRGPSDVETQWQEDLPRWTSGGWRENLFAGFDLAPAREMLDAGRYAAAQREIERSIRLFSDLGLTARQAEAEPLLRRAEQGLQAEALMEQTQQALDRHAYERAGALLDQAEALYATAPEALRPEAVIARYRQLVTLGVGAGARLDEALASSASWRDYPRARESALAAGTAFAELGDAEMHGQAVSLLHDLDDRQRRLTIVLALLALLCAAWLALWLWARGPSELDWGPAR